MHTTDTHMFANCWRSPPDDPDLARNEIHVWRFPLDVPEADSERHFHLLSNDERDRANRFVFKKDRTHFTAARAALRRVLGRYLRADPVALEFVYGRHGKPALNAGRGDPGLKFNLSHSGGIALIALARAHEVGIDVERIRLDFPCRDIARQFFSDAEYRDLCALEPALIYEAFFNCWTRKEAFIKATGAGLSCPLNQFDVSLRPSAPARLLSLRGQAVSAGDYSLHALSPGDGYIGALAVAGDCSRVRLWTD